MLINCSNVIYRCILCLFFRKCNCLALRSNIWQLWMAYVISNPQYIYDKWIGNWSFKIKTKWKQSRNQEWANSDRSNIHIEVRSLYRIYSNISNNCVSSRRTVSIWKLCMSNIDNYIKVFLKICYKTLNYFYTISTIFVYPDASSYNFHDSICHALIVLYFLFNSIPHSPINQLCSLYPILSKNI